MADLYYANPCRKESKSMVWSTIHNRVRPIDIYTVHTIKGVYRGRQTKKREKFAEFCYSFSGHKYIIVFGIFKVKKMTILDSNLIFDVGRIIPWECRKYESPNRQVGMVHTL